MHFIKLFLRHPPFLSLFFNRLLLGGDLIINTCVQALAYILKPLHQGKPLLLNMAVWGILCFSSFFIISHTMLSVADAKNLLVKRKILALYDGRHYKESALTNIHKYAELPLNYMGYDVRYHDISKSLPVLSKLNDYKGIITWFGAPVPEPVKYLRWADKAIISGLKFALLSDIGAEPTLKTRNYIKKFLAHLGLKLKDQYVARPRGTKTFKLNKEFIGFERPLYEIFPTYSIFERLNSAVKVHLSVRPPIEYKSAEGLLVTTNKAGGFVHSGFSIYYNESINRTKWILNPFTFFEAVFGGERMPIPDTATLVGRRMYFSHIDGDGWNNISYIEHYNKTKTIAAEVVLKEFIAPYPDLPVSVALVTGDCDADLGGDPKGCDTVARQMYALPQVEVASHTHTHPFNWQFFGKYSRKVEQSLIKKHQPKENQSLRGMLTAFMARYAGKLTARERNKRYIAGSDKLPRAFMKHPYTLKSEIANSLRIAEKYAPKGKKAKLLQWSGNTMPRASHIKAVRDAGAVNLNGGDSRFDNEWPSLSYVSAISRQIGGERQIYAANSNENTYTNDWTGPYYGFLHLGETVRNTEKPRRLKPFNIYYHSYSGERHAALNAVKTHLNSARKGVLVPVEASHYAKVASGFFSIKIKKIGALAWSFENRGDLQTLRFEAAQKLGVNWDKSHGVIGINRHTGSAYIALDPNVAKPILALVHNSKGVNKKHQPILKESRWRINSVKGSMTHFSFKTRGYGDGDMVWQGLKAKGLYGVIAYNAQGKAVWESQKVTDSTGQLSVKIKTSAITPLKVTVGHVSTAVAKPK